VSNALREIIAHFGFDFDKGKAAEADKHIEGIKGHSEEATAGVEGLMNAFKAAAGIELGREIVEWTGELAEAGDAIGDLSEATGLSTEQLQVWQFGAAKSGENAEVFTQALRKLSSAVAGGADEAGSQAKVFSKLNIKTKEADGSIRNLSDILGDVAEHFASTEDGAGKAALAQELFGRSGSKLIPLLNGGRQGVAALTQEFRDLGGGFSQEAIEKAGEMKAAIARNQVAITSFKSELTVALLPKMNDLLENITALVGRFNDWQKSTTFLDSAIDSLALTLGVTLWAALSPFMAGALKFAAIYLAVDDLKGFLEGQDSEIGAILDGWFGNGTADTVREWVMSAVDFFTEGFADIRAALPAISADIEYYFTSAFTLVDEAWNVLILKMIGDWNALASKLHLPELDGTKVVNRVTADEMVRSQAKAKQIDTMKDVLRFNQDATPTSNAISTAVSPVMAPTRETHWNMVTNAPQISITVPPGTPERVTRDIAKQTREALHETHRAALQALENRSGG
jgi:TP901 family phage tail tape measure protein